MSDRAAEFRALPRLGEFTPADLDGEMPIFPLAGALLLPHGRMPLNVFEPRYLAMIDDALRGRRLIGMIQPQRTSLDDDEEEFDNDPDRDRDRDRDADFDDDDDPEEQGELTSLLPGRALGGGAGSPGIRSVSQHAPLLIGRPQAPAIYQVGCVGRLTSFMERDDGTCAITLAGIGRFRVRRELETMRGYRRVDADSAAFAGDLKPPSPASGFDRDGLIEALRRYFTHRGFEARWEAIDEMDDDTLIITLSMICPFPTAEKQALLEAHTVIDRARTLLALLQMAGHEPNDGSRKTHAV